MKLKSNSFYLWLLVITGVAVLLLPILRGPNGTWLSRAWWWFEYVNPVLLAANVVMLVGLVVLHRRYRRRALSISPSAHDSSDASPPLVDEELER